MRGLIPALTTRFLRLPSSCSRSSIRKVCGSSVPKRSHTCKVILAQKTCAVWLPNIMLRLTAVTFNALSTDDLSAALFHDAAVTCTGRGPDRGYCEIDRILVADRRAT